MVILKNSDVAIAVLLMYWYFFYCCYDSGGYSITQFMKMGQSVNVTTFFNESNKQSVNIITDMFLNYFSYFWVCVYWL